MYLWWNNTRHQHLTMQPDPIPANPQEYDVTEYDADEEAEEDPRWTKRRELQDG